jgi:putative SOS response-associated peptidase YedK
MMPPIPGRDSKGRSRGPPGSPAPLEEPNGGGRFPLFSDGAELARLFGCGFELPLEPRYNIAPSQPVPVVRLAEDQPGTRQAALLQWGLVPSWTGDPTIGLQCINARSETAASKPAFRAAFRRRRCLIPANGFYEWQKKGKEKLPFLFRLRGGPPFAFAGLWERWSSPHGDGRETCTILTAEANDLVRPFHERIPIILPAEQYGDWLDPMAAAPQWLQTVLRPYHAEAMQAVAVSTWVNDARHKGTECVRPVG